MLTIYKASAGSGKTYRLARDYIFLLLALKDQAGNLRLNLIEDASGAHPRINNRHRNILAITFTRKATNEMKTRILNELNALAKLPAPGEKDAAYAPYIQEKLQCTRAQLAQASKLALSQLLFGYQDFNVFTIDAFFQRVLHTFARELDRQTDYDVELDDKMVMQMAVGEMIDTFNSESQPGSALEDWIYQFMKSKVDEGVSSNFFNRNSGVLGNLVTQLSNITKEDFKKLYMGDMESYLSEHDSDKGLQAFKKALYARRQALHNCIKAIAAEALEGRRGFNCEGLAKNRLPYTLLHKIIPEGKMPSYDQNKKLNKKSRDDDWKNGYVGILKKGSCTPEQLEAFHAWYCEISQLYCFISDIDCIISSLGQLGLLQHAWPHLDKLRKDNNMLLLSDTNELVSRIIGKDPTPFVYERMGVQLTNFLIDEFQDTSHMQWDNLKPLIANSISQYDSLVIGDEKQSIYRWRNSDSSILSTEIKEDFKGICQFEGTTAGENTNYRTSGLVVKFNNTLFARIAQEKKLGSYSNVVQNISERYSNTPGYVRIINSKALAEAVAKQMQEEAKERELSSSGKEADATIQCEIPGKDEIVLNEMAREILRQHTSGHYQWRDIAILTRTNDEACLAVNFLLKNYPEIKVSSLEALRISNSSAVQIVVNALKLMDAENQKPRLQPKASQEKRRDASRALTVLTRAEHYMRAEGMDPTSALILAQQSQERQPGEKDASEQSGEQKADCMQRIRDMKPSSLSALVEIVIKEFVSEAEQQAQFSYIAAFQDLVQDYMERNEAAGSLHAFLDWWKHEGVKRNVQDDASTDAVQVMTVHKAKGLEFGCVHIPFCNWNMHWSNNQKPEMWVPVPAELGINPSVCPPAIYIPLVSALDNGYSVFSQLYQDELDKAFVDQLNCTYVAFTRAKQELLVWYTPGTDNVGELLEKAFTSTSMVNAPAECLCQLHFDDPSSNFSLTLGEPTTKHEDKAKADQPDSDNARQDAVYRVYLREDAHDYTRVEDSLSIDSELSWLTTPEDADKPEDAINLEQPKTLGLIMHEIMAGVVHVEDLDKAVRQVAVRRKLNETEVDDYKAQALALLQMAGMQTQRWYGDFQRVFIEQSIYIPGAKIDVRRPDRVVVCSDGGTDVIDYKFTDDPSLPDHKAYIAQVKTYMAALAQMGFKKLRGVIIYPKLEKIEYLQPS